MVTREEALKEDMFHEEGCKRTYGPRGGVTVSQVMWRRNGKTKTWKTNPERFYVPLKHGFYGPYAGLTEDNANRYHTARNCPLQHETSFTNKEEK